MVFIMGAVGGNTNHIVTAGGDDMNQAKMNVLNFIVNNIRSNSNMTKGCLNYGRRRNARGTGNDNEMNGNSG